MADLVTKTDMLSQNFEYEDRNDIPEEFLNMRFLTEHKQDSEESAHQQLNLRQMMELHGRETPRHPQQFRMWCCQARLKTLTTCGDNLAVLPQATIRNIARAGFYHSGTPNTLVCFYCGCHAHNWAANDDPWDRHIELQSNCPMVRRNVNVKMTNGRVAHMPRRRNFSESDACPAPARYAQ